MSIEEMLQACREEFADLDCEIMRAEYLPGLWLMRKKSTRVHATYLLRGEHGGFVVRCINEIQANSMEEALKIVREILDPGGKHE